MFWYFAWPFLLIAAISAGLWPLVIAFTRKKTSGAQETLVSYPILLVFKIAFIAILLFSFGGGLNEHRSGLDLWALVVPVMIPIAFYFIGRYDDSHDLGSRRKLAIISMTWLGIAAARALTPNADHFFSFNDWETLIQQTLLGFALTLALPLIDGLDGLFSLYCAAAILAVNEWHISDCCSSLRQSFRYAPEFFIAITLSIVLFQFVPWNCMAKRVRLGEAAVFACSYFAAFLISESFQPDSLFDSRYRGDSAISWLILIVVLIPITDFFLAILFRKFNGRSAFASGHDHLHHRLMQSGWSPLKTMLMMSTPAIVMLVWRLYDIFESVTRSMSDDSSLLYARSREIYILPALCLSSLITLYLFWRGYTKVNPYKSGAVNERGRP